MPIQTLYKEYRLIQRNDNDINIAWKGTRLLLFFLAFVFGSFCTFCFHILMYMFDRKCVLFPNITKHSTLRHVAYEYLSINVEGPDRPKGERPPIEFISMQWVDTSVCYLPTYVPLVSGLFGLVWTTMYLMCSSAIANRIKMQRQWRSMPVIFVFSVAMGGVCLYATTITDKGLRDLCSKLAYITGSSSCTYTVNVASLLYERRIRGVYQATQLTIITAWLHTSCWLLSALTTLLRVLLAVDFQLVCVRADLIGDIDVMLEKYERQLHHVAPESTVTSSGSTKKSPSSFSMGSVYQESTTKSIYNFRYKTERHKSKKRKHHTDSNGGNPTESTVYLLPSQELYKSELCLVPEEEFKLAKHKAYERVSQNHRFLVKMVYDIVENIDVPYSSRECDLRSESDVFEASSIVRQKGRVKITAFTGARFHVPSLFPEESENMEIESKQSDSATLFRYLSMDSLMSEGYSTHKSQEQFESDVYKVGETSTKTSHKEDITKLNLKSSPRKVQIIDKSKSKDSVEIKELIDLLPENDDCGENKRHRKTNTGTGVNTRSVDKESQISKEKQD